MILWIFLAIFYEIVNRERLEVDREILGVWIVFNGYISFWIMEIGNI